MWIWVNVSAIFCCFVASLRDAVGGVFFLFYRYIFPPGKVRRNLREEVFCGLLFNAAEKAAGGVFERFGGGDDVVALPELGAREVAHLVA